MEAWNARNTLRPNAVWQNEHCTHNGNSLKWKQKKKWNIATRVHDGNGVAVANSAHSDTETDTHAMPHCDVRAQKLKWKWRKSSEWFTSFSAMPRVKCAATERAQIVIKQSQYCWSFSLCDRIANALIHSYFNFIVLHTHRRTHPD